MQLTPRDNHTSDSMFPVEVEAMFQSVKGKECAVLCMSDAIEEASRHVDYIRRTRQRARVIVGVLSSERTTFIGLHSPHREMV